jgi:superfamily II DNA/RNA helicase
MPILTGYETIFSIQTHAIKPIVELTSALLVGEERSGKTISFLIPILSHLLDNVETNENDNDQEKIEENVNFAQGPTALIISSSLGIENDYYTCKDLLKSTKHLDIVKCSASKNLEALTICLLNGCDMLFSTPGKFCRLIKYKSLKLFNKEKLRFVVFDNIDSIIDNSLVEINEILNLHDTTSR